MQEFDECNMKRIDYDEYRKNISFPIINFFKKYGFDGNMLHYEEVSKNFHERYMNKLPEINLFLDVKDTLSFLKEHGARLTILSVLKQELLIESVEKFGIYKYFDNILGLKSGDGGSKIQKALKWFKANNFKKEEFLMIGDTVHDAEVAKALDIDCILVARGDQHKDTLLKTGYRVFDSLKEVVEYFKSEYAF